MNGHVFTLTQVLDLIGLIQAVFVIGLTLVRTDDYRFAALPLTLFGTFAIGFLIKVLMSVGLLESSGFMLGVYLFVDTLVPALSYLMILELVRLSIPDSRHWLILGLPILAVPVINVAVQTEAVCLDGGGSMCFDPFDFFALYRLITGMVILLVLILLIRKDLKILPKQTMGREKYWIVISLIALNIAILGALMAALSDWLTEDQTSFVVVALELTLIYLLMSSLFRVYAGAVPVRPMVASTKTSDRDPLNSEEQALVEKIQNLMTLDKVYQEATYSRKDLAQELGVAEHQLSRVINTGFEMSFSDLINSHRVDEAKYLLRTTEEAVSSIAFDVGFNSLASFNRVFRKVVGKTPTEYRANPEENSQIST